MEGGIINRGTNGANPVSFSNICPRTNSVTDTQQAMLYHRQDIERHIKVLQSHASEPWTRIHERNSLNIARLSDQALRFDEMTEAHAQGFGGTATDPEVMRCTDMLTDVTRSGEALETAITELGLVLKDRDSVRALSNLRQLVTEK
jgi:hypothetical protein